MDAAAFARLDDLRRRHFPPQRNVLAAHLTLFHALPGEEEDRVRADLRAAAAGAGPVAGAVDRVLALGRGVALRVEAPALGPLRAELAARWAAWLTPQDRQGFRAHVTIQNKVAPAAARALHDALAAGFEPFPVTLDGLQLWRYLGGPWEPVAEWRLTGAASQ